MSVSVTDIDKFIAEKLKDTELMVKVQEMMQYVLDGTVEELKDVRFKYTDPSELKEEAIKQIMAEQGFEYIVSVMDTITNFEFNTMLSFMDLINQLKGTKKGLELVLNLLGFSSTSVEWWENPDDQKEPWSYEIIIFVNSSNVPDLFKTLDAVAVFSDNYVLAKLSNVEIRFVVDQFAEVAPIMGGFAKSTYRGKIIERAI